MGIFLITDTLRSHIREQVAPAAWIARARLVRDAQRRRWICPEIFESDVVLGPIT
jgi:hypothetical protein